ncbi:hypothetical protein SAMN05421858_3554 [Haladaptatus litoreus]|uniref:Uncharacterized protein n=1 Tax=Haladaptatus litoreus TaxID=553468 RepID=A0A1N7DEE5_9EURY|nr:hypothetical protein SAMN05421858_3554 [Haladaptatus litoreus]
MDSTTEGEFNSLRAPFRSRGSDNTRFGVFGRIGTSVRQRPHRTVKVGGFTHRPTPPVSPSLLQSDFERLLTVASNWNTVRRRPNSSGCGDCVRDSPHESPDPWNSRCIFFRNVPSPLDASHMCILTTHSYTQYKNDYTNSDRECYYRNIIHYFFETVHL